MVKCDAFSPNIQREILKANAPTLPHQRVLQLSWLERYTDNVEVGSSTLPGTT